MRTPFHGTNGSFVVITKLCYGICVPGEGSKVPDFERTIIPARGNKCISPVPMDYIDVFIMCILLGDQASFIGFGSRIPNSNSEIQMRSLEQEQIKECGNVGEMGGWYPALPYVLSTEQEAKTFGSFGDHWISSTESVCPVNGRWSTIHVDSCGLQIWINFVVSPVARTPGSIWDQSMANPSPR